MSYTQQYPNCEVHNCTTILLQFLKTLVGYFVDFDNFIQNTHYPLQPYIHLGHLKTADLQARIMSRCGALVQKSYFLIHLKTCETGHSAWELFTLSNLHVWYQYLCVAERLTASVWWPQTSRICLGISILKQYQNNQNECTVSYSSKI